MGKARIVRKVLARRTKLWLVTLISFALMLSSMTMQTFAADVSDCVVTNGMPTTYTYGVQTEYTLNFTWPAAARTSGAKCYFTIHCNDHEPHTHYVAVGNTTRVATYPWNSIQQGKRADCGSSYLTFHFSFYDKNENYIGDYYIGRVDREQAPTTPASITVNGGSRPLHNTAFSVNYSASSSVGGTISGYNLQRRLRTASNASWSGWSTISTANTTTVNGQSVSRTTYDRVQYQVQAQSATGKVSGWRQSAEIDLEGYPNPSTTITVNGGASGKYGVGYSVTWSGSSAGAGGSIGGHVLERRLYNGSSWGAYTQVQNSTATSKSETLARDSATQVQYRVKTRSGSGLESAYKESNAMAVTNNVAPTTVSWGTQPAGSVNSWSVTTLNWAWNAATDSDGDTLTYEVSLSRNGGAYSVVQTSAIRTYSCAINMPSDVSFSLRVRAYDAREYSGYITSNVTNIVYDKEKPKIKLEGG